MKRLCVVIVVLVIVISCGACSKTSVDESADITLTFIHADENISVTLDEDETKKVLDILDGKCYDPAFCSLPSCGFDGDISLKVGNRFFLIACDTCNYIQDLGNLRYFQIPIEDMEYIHWLFEKYGGYFPCVS